MTWLARRKLLFFGAAAASGAAGHFFSAAITKIVDKGYDSAISDLFGPDYSGTLQVDLVKALFASGSQPTAFCPGMHHYRFPGTTHPDDEFAGKTFARVASDIAGREKVTIISGTIPLSPAHYECTLVCGGSPVSNGIARSIMDYEYVDFAHPEKGLRRLQDSPIHLRFEYFLTTRRILDLGGDAARFQRIPGAAGYDVPNWCIKDTWTGQVFAPSIDHQGKILTDYLLVSVLPNHLTMRGWREDERIIVFGGTHGAGTRAIDLLFRDRSLLMRLVVQSRGHRAWQALFKCTEIDRSGFRPHPTKLDADFQFAALQLDVSEIERRISSELP